MYVYTPGAPVGSCGKTVGNFDAISWSSASVSGVVVTRISFPARENWNSLTVVGPSAVVSFTARLRLGVLQSDERVVNGASPHRLPRAWSSVQDSSIHRTIRFVLSVIAAS